MHRQFLKYASALALLLTGCCNCLQKNATEPRRGDTTVKLITLDPGHFHAALIQKQMYPEVSAVVHVYAPEGVDLNLHLDRISSFNSRAENPTAWQTKLYTGKDFLEKMLAEKAGNVVVLAGNNARKTEYILKSIQAGFNVLSDKPMAITPKDFEMLKQAFEIAQQKGLFLYDIMTERYEITSILQKELSRFPLLYGTQDTGTSDDPAVVKESVHHFNKLVAGKPLQRPAWYYDTLQQGEAIVDVNTHLTDLIQWALFPDTVLSPKDITMLQARTWNTPLTLEQYKKSTSQNIWPDYLQKDLDAQGVLQCKANGEFTYKIRGVYAKASVLWNFEAPAGTGDTHFSLMRGSRASLIIQQGAAEGYKPVLYVEPRRNTGVPAGDIATALQKALTEINKLYPGISFEAHETGWRINIPESYAVGHEAHFGQVAKKYLEFIKRGSMPAWEVPNMLVKYHTLMEAYKKSR